MRYEIMVTPNGGGRFAAHLDGRLLHKSTRQPLLDCARVLLKEGADPQSTIAMRHNGSDHVALSGKIGAVAKLTIEESDDDPMRIRVWKPFEGASVPGRVPC
jgi:hypothetical protein